jgi:hypothetical protein
MLRFLGFETYVRTPQNLILEGKFGKMIKQENMMLESARDIAMFRHVERKLQRLGSRGDVPEATMHELDCKC